MDTSRIVAGTMTGTSIDGIDLALTRITGAGLAMKVELLGHLSRPLGELAPSLRAMARNSPMTAEEFTVISERFGQLHADALLELARQAEVRIDLVACHGQTVFHRPPHSLQLLDPAPISRALDCPIVFNLRRSDLLAGGEGAPLTPIADWILFRNHSAMAIVNLGGFANITLLPPSDQSINQVLGFDLCPCNQLLDEIARIRLDQPIDDQGRVATRGTVDQTSSMALKQRFGCEEAVRSLGTDDEAFDWIDSDAGTLSDEDALATAIDAITSMILDACEGIDQLCLAGGGCRNMALVEALGRTGKSIILTDQIGIPAQAREAVAIAMIGTLAQDHVHPGLRQITGYRDEPSFHGFWVNP